MVWSVTARQWHTYTTARLGQPDLMVKAAERSARERVRPVRRVVAVGRSGVTARPWSAPRWWSWSPTASVMVTFLIVTFLVGVPSPLAGTRSPIFWATSRPCGHRAEDRVVGRRGPSVPVPVTTKNCEPAVPAGPAVGHRHRADLVAGRVGSSPGTRVAGATRCRRSSGSRPGSTKSLTTRWTSRPS